MSRGREVVRDRARTIRAARRVAPAPRAPGSSARIVPLPGSAMPSASHRQFIELAVNMPEHEPQVGQALLLELVQLAASVILPAW